MEPLDQAILDVVGANLAAERARRGHTQANVAGLAGLHVAQVARMERGAADTGLSKYVHVAWAMGLAPDELFAGLEQPDYG